MKIELASGPRRIAFIPSGRRVHLRVTGGTIRLAEDPQTLTDGAGIPVSSADGLVSLVWDSGPLWMAPDGGPATIQLVLPA